MYVLLLVPRSYNSRVRVCLHDAPPPLGVMCTPGSAHMRVRVIAVFQKLPVVRTTPPGF